LHLLPQTANELRALTVAALLIAADYYLRAFLRLGELSAEFR